MSDYKEQLNGKDQLQQMGLEGNALYSIRASITEKIVGEYFSPDSNYPENPVAFLNEWLKEKKIGEYGELIVEGKNDYLIVSDGNPYRAEDILPAINKRVDDACDMLAKVMPTLQDAYLDKYMTSLFKDIKTDKELIAKTVEKLDEGIYATDLLQYVHEALREEKPDMSIEESYKQSMKILRLAEKEYYSMPIEEKSIVAEIYDNMKAVARDVKDIVHSLDKLKSKGVAILRSLGNDSKTKGSASSR